MKLNRKQKETKLKLHLLKWEGVISKSKSALKMTAVWSDVASSRPFNIRPLKQTVSQSCLAAYDRFGKPAWDSKDRHRGLGAGNSLTPAMLQRGWGKGEEIRRGSSLLCLPKWQWGGSRRKGKEDASMTRGWNMQQFCTITPIPAGGSNPR